jgi:bifunctional non-homologous end joining protein LigD
MLARPDRLPRGDYSYEVKWDGFRAIVSTEDALLVRSRRGWNMSDRLPDLAALPGGLVLAGELVSFGEDGRPSFPLLSLRVLHGRTAIPVTLMISDVLRVEGATRCACPTRSGGRCSKP